MSRPAHIECFVNAQVVPVNRRSALVNRMEADFTNLTCTSSCSFPNTGIFHTSETFLLRLKGAGTHDGRKKKMKRLKVSKNQTDLLAFDTSEYLRCVQCACLCPLIRHSLIPPDGFFRRLKSFVGEHRKWQLVQ
jgi:hypothetical protein